MIYIAHRGLINGPNKELENKPIVIEESLRNADYAEIDLWVQGDDAWLGHDNPQYRVDWNWLYERKQSLILHCKNIPALLKLCQYQYDDNSYWHYFWHEHDTVTLTSLGWIWAYPGKQPIENSIAVLPEINDDDCSDAFGICTDYVVKYKRIYK